MFNLQGSEIIIVLLLALVVLGPEKLPDAMRKMGQAYAELKKMSAGFQSEFRAAVDEPLREVRETANVLRDSADFTKLQQGERPEKPKSGDMAQLAPADPDPAPSADTPTFDTRPGTDHGPGVAADSEQAPFDDDTSSTPEAGSAEAGPPETGSAAATRRPPTRTPVPTPPPPFTGMSAAVPEPAETGSDDAGEPDGDPLALDEAELGDHEADTTR